MTQKRKIGRPARKVEVKRCNIHIEMDLYEYIISNKGEMTVTDYINMLIREEAGL